MRIQIVFLLLLAACGSSAPAKSTMPLVPARRIAAPSAPAPSVPPSVAIAEQTLIPGVYTPIEGRRRIPAPVAEPADAATPYDVIAQANRAAANAPTSDGFFNAIQEFVYTPGVPYQVYCATMHVTDIALQPGEKHVGPLVTGDSVRWVLGVTKSAEQGVDQEHVVVKPTQPGLSTNLIINTNRRTYHIDLHSYKDDTYMVAVKWRYPHDEIGQLVAQANEQQERQRNVVGTMNPASLNFRYALEILEGEPRWLPHQVFDDGRKTYIRFPADMVTGEVPVLFLVRHGELQLLNYFPKGEFYCRGPPVRNSRAARRPEAPRDRARRTDPPMTTPQDPHASKISPNDPRLKRRLSRVRYLRKGPTLIALAVVVVALAVSVTFAVEPRPKRTRNEISALDTQSRLPSEILDAPDVVPPKAAVDAGVPVPATPQEPPKVYDIPTSTPLRERNTPESRQKQRVADEYLKARGADLFVQVRGLPAAPVDDETRSRDDESPRSGDATMERLQHARRALAELEPTEPSNGDFRATAMDRGDGYLHTRLQRPRSPYELKAGAIIPAVLQTAINSDLAGPVFAKVRENVYDSITHENIVIPQNSTLIASYDSRIAWGQQRVLLCWQRIVFPNGTSLQLECMPGGDLTGAAGLADEVDEHWWRLAKGAGLASLLSAGTSAAAGNTTGYNPTIPQQVARGAASEFGRAGEHVTRRELMVAPTITIRAGWSMNVLVTKDMILEPYPVDVPATEDETPG